MAIYTFYHGPILVGHHELRKSTSRLLHTYSWRNKHAISQPNWRFVYLWDGYGCGHWHWNGPRNSSVDAHVRDWSIHRFHHEFLNLCTRNSSSPVPQL